MLWPKSDLPFGQSHHSIADHAGADCQDAATAGQPASLMEAPQRRGAQRAQDVNTPAAKRSASGAVSLDTGWAANALLQLREACAGVLGTSLPEMRLHAIGQPACAASHPGVLCGRLSIMAPSTFRWW